MKIRNQNSIFHVHTYRCGHAENIPDEKYIREAIKIGAEKIYFADHAPFPGDPFGNRMKYNELNEYICTLSDLREKYKSQIEVVIGLEIEYLKAFEQYYTNLKEQFDFLLLGQHIYELAPGSYHFMKNISGYEKSIGILENIINGLSTGYFTYLAHPDRYFIEYDIWNEEYARKTNRIKEICLKNHIFIEYNLKSAEKCECSKIFWKNMSDYPNIIVGCDAHRLADIK
jgi:histidinol-phosphatase (PHP family)